MEKVKKNKTNRLEQVVPIRISREKYQEFSALLEQSRCRSMSELLRKILDNRKISIDYHDKSKNNVLEELALIRKEIQAIGVNINQVTRRFNAEGNLKHRLAQSLEILHLFQQTDEKITRLFELMAKLSESW